MFGTQHRPGRLFYHSLLDASFPDKVEKRTGAAMQERFHLFAEPMRPKEIDCQKRISVRFLA